MGDHLSSDDQRVVVGRLLQNQQQQFEQNVQDLFGLKSSQTNNEIAGNYYIGGHHDYDPFTSVSTKDVNTSAFITAVYLNSILFVILIGGYELFRRLLPSVYSPKNNGTRSRLGSSSSSLVGSSPLSSPMSSSNAASAASAVNINTQTPLGWVKGVARASWSTVRSSGGLDSYMFLRYIRLCFRISFTSALWGMIILWPGEYREVFILKHSSCGSNLTPVPHLLAF